MKSIISLVAVLGFTAAANAACPSFEFGMYSCKDKISGRTLSLNLMQATDEGNPALSFQMNGGEATKPIACITRSAQINACTAEQRKDANVDAQCTAQFGAGNQVVAVLNATSNDSALDTNVVLGSQPIAGGAVTQLVDATTNVEKINESTVRLFIKVIAEGKTQTVDLTCAR